MGKKKARPVPCKACDFMHDANLGGWVILASGELICDPVNRPKCWEKIATLTNKKNATLTNKKQGLTNANSQVR